MAHEISRRFDGVQIALGEGLSAGGRGAKRVDQRNLDEVVTVGGLCDKAPSLRSHHVHTTIGVQLARESPELAGNEIDHLRVELHRRDVIRAVHERREHF